MKVVCIENVVLSENSEEYGGFTAFTRGKIYTARRIRSLSERFGGEVLRAKNDLGKQHIIGGARGDLAEFFEQYFKEA